MLRPSWWVRLVAQAHETYEPHRKFGVDLVDDIEQSLRPLTEEQWKWWMERAIGEEGPLPLLVASHGFSAAPSHVSDREESLLRQLLIKFKAYNGLKLSHLNQTKRSQATTKTLSLFLSLCEISDEFVDKSFANDVIKEVTKQDMGYLTQAAFTIFKDERRMRLLTNNNRQKLVIANNSKK